MIAQLDAQLIVRYVQDSIDQGRAVEESGPNASRNALQTVTLLDAMAEFKFEAALGGARRDEEKARAKERFFSHRDMFGQWDPKESATRIVELVQRTQTPRTSISVSFRSATGRKWISGSTSPLNRSRFPNSTSRTSAPSSTRDGVLLAACDYISVMDGEKVENKTVRFRTIGDMTCTGAVESTASTIDEIIQEVAAARVTERGARVGR